MNIIYFTTAQDKADFSSYISLWNTPINTSNQTFHNKLIRAIAINNHVDVVSIRPFSKKKCNVDYLERGDTIDDTIHWHYPRIRRGKFLGFAPLKKEINNLFKNFYRNSLIVTDTINPTVLYLATTFAKKYNMPIIGVCTDSPSNIAGTNRAYTMLLLRMAKTLEGYICLTQGLNELFNDQNKPAIIFEGVVENDEPEKAHNEYGKYIFYCGALSEKYGIYNFINFFQVFIKGDVKLLICGHHADEERLNAIANNDPRIIYLGNILNDEVLNLEANAWCNINPRPFSEDLDRYSVPSKVLEFLNSGAPTISVKNTRLQKYLNADAIWIKNNSDEDFIEAFQKLNSFTEEDKKMMVERAREHVQLYYSVDAINNKLDSFLYLFTRKRT
ncbi:MAG: glycosyltransferase [Bacilli bacterium]|nr:glycosyltransferase [Bacilli bacterium]